MVNKKSPYSKIMEEDSGPETDVSKEFTNFFTDEIKKIYWAEKYLVKSFPKIHKAATAERLKNAFTNHFAIVRLQVERLEQIFEVLSEPPKAKKCEAMSALLEVSFDIIEETEKGAPLRDLGLIFAAQKLASYKAETYGTLIQLAEKMGNEDIISLLQDTLSEEKQAGELLNALAEAGIHNSASTGGVEKKGSDIADEITAVYDSVNLTRKHKGK